MRVFELVSSARRGVVPNGAKRPAHYATSVSELEQKELIDTRCGSICINATRPPDTWASHLKRNVLFICTANLQRSPTAESLFQNWGGRWETKSAGINPEPGGTLLTQELVDWADLVLVMEAVHAYYIKSHFKCDSSKLRVLGIRDRLLS